MTDIPEELQRQFEVVFEQLGIFDEGVEGIEVKFYYTEGNADNVYAEKLSDGSVDIHYLISARYDGESVTDDERNDT